MSDTGPTPSTQDLLFLQIGFGGIGGIASVSRALADGLKEFGHRSVCIRHGLPEQLIEGASSWDGIEVATSLPRKGRINARALGACARAVHRLRPDVVVAHDHSLIPAAFIGFLLSRRRPRIIMVEHQAIDLRSPGINIRSFIGLLLSSALVCHTKDYARRYPFRRFPTLSVRRMAIIGNAVDTGFFRPAIARAASPDQWNIGMAARFTPTKDLPTLISAIGLLNSSDSQARWHLQLAGDGPRRSELIAHAHNCGVASDVTFLGQLDQPALRNFLQNLDIYVQSTQGETMCTAVLQALACAVPVVASDVDGLSVMVEDRVEAILVPPRDPSALAETLRELAGDPELRTQLAAAGRSLTENSYGITAAAEKYLALCDRIGLPAAVTNRTGLFGGS